MLSIDEEPIRSLTEFMDRCLAAAHESPEPLWFRGQRTAGRGLVPSLYRNMRPVADGRGNPVPPDFVGHSSATVYAYPNFAAMRLEFKRLATPFLQAMIRPPSDEFEWIFLMQHYGVRTRLLDWSTDPMIALYFAVQSGATSKPGTGDAVVYLLEPGEVNRRTVDVDAIISLNEEDWGHYLEPGSVEADFPICVAPAHIDPRVIAQSSVFTLHGYLLASLDSYQPLHDHVAEVAIDRAAISRIRGDLEALGYDRARVFPELSTIAERVLKAGEARFTQSIPETEAPE
jgi:hypothetical protein